MPGGRPCQRCREGGAVLCFFASDLHGSIDRYESLFGVIAAERPRAVFLGGDLLPMHYVPVRSLGIDGDDFIRDYVSRRLRDLADRLGTGYPSVFVILGNDDPAVEEAAVLKLAELRLWTYVHGRRADLDGFTVYGYARVPPTPFLLKDWEQYDVSRFVDPGAVSPEEGHRSVQLEPHRIRHATISADLEELAGTGDLTRSIFLFHAPPYNTVLDRAALDGKRVDHVPLDVHVGSIAIRRFIETRQPLVTLHGHVHESPRMTGSWRDHIGRTWCLSAAHDGPELALVRFDPASPEDASRELL
jgi:Icc-related predicted phosphoesterase